MNPTPCSSRAFRWLAAGAGLATALYASRAALTWLQYGHPPSPDMDEADRLLDEFIPTYEVVERHHVRCGRASRDCPSGGLRHGSRAISNHPRHLQRQGADPGRPA